MLILPPRFKPAARRHHPSWYACLVISSHPVEQNIPLVPQKSASKDLTDRSSFALRTLGFDASEEARELTDELESWRWKENTSLCIENVKIVHETNLLAVRWPKRPRHGLKLSRGSFQQVLYQVSPSLLGVDSNGFEDEDDKFIN